MTKWTTTVSGLACVLLLYGCNYRPVPAGRSEQSDVLLGSDTAKLIQKYSDAIEESRDTFQAAVQAAGRVAYFNKLLAIEYIKVGMFGLALESLQEALLIEPNNEILLYLSGVSAMHLGRIYLPSNPAREQLVMYAEHALQRSIDLNADYADPLFAISMLYVFERSESDRALPYLEQLRAVDENNPHAHALLGRVYTERDEVALATQSYRRAADLYDNPEYRRQSLENIAIIQSWSGEYE